MRYLLALLAPPVAVWNSKRPFQAILNVPLCILGWVPGVVHALYCTASGPVLSSPEQITRFIVDNFLKVGTKDYSTFERTITRAAPRSLERELVYALRVSSVLPTLTNLKTLASRWDTAHCGAGASGLELGRASHNFTLVYDFLTRQYLEHVQRILESEQAAFRGKHQQAATDKARETTRQKWLEKLITYRTLFSYQLNGLDHLIERYTNAA